jgi:hypothetical protein
MGEWQSIETAPKDGTEILAWCQPRFIETGKPMVLKYINVVWWRADCFPESEWKWRHTLNDSAAEPIMWMPLPEA